MQCLPLHIISHECYYIDQKLLYRHIVSANLYKNVMFERDNLHYVCCSVVIRLYWAVVFHIFMHDHWHRDTYLVLHPA